MIVSVESKSREMTDPIDCNYQAYYNSGGNGSYFVLFRNYCQVGFIDSVDDNTYIDGSTLDDFGIYLTGDTEDDIARFMDTINNNGGVEFLTDAQYIKHGDGTENMTSSMDEYVGA